MNERHKKIVDFIKSKGGYCFLRDLKALGIGYERLMKEIRVLEYYQVLKSQVKHSRKKIWVINDDYQPLERCTIDDLI